MGSLYATPLYCRAWTCSTCAPRRAAQLRWLARSGEPTSFLTLTVNPARGESPERRARDLRDAWRWLRRKMRRRWPGQAFPFLAVFERTKKGEPHLHILLRGCYVPQDWLSDQMRARLGAPIVDIRHVRDQNRAAAYVAKYLAKAPASWAGCKRYWRSQDWQLWPDEVRPKLADRTWLIKTPVADLWREAATTGISVSDQVRGPPIEVLWWLGEVRELRL